MDFEKLKSEIREISTIATEVPEPFRETCFKMLLEALLKQQNGSKKEGPVETGNAPDLTREKVNVPTPSQVRVFMERVKVTQEELNALMLFDGEQVHFVREPSPKTVAKGQIAWALLLALKAAVESNSFQVDPEDVRSICQEKGFYDRSNFASIFKRSANAKLFKNPPEPQGEPQQLTTDGQMELGKLVKKLTGADE